MTPTFPVEAIAALATVVAALIAGLIAVVSLTLTKEQKTSEFRQAWIDGLRQDLSDFLAASRACTRAFEEQAALGSAYLDHPSTMRADKIGDLRHAVAQTHYKIKLRLNPEKAEHIELLRLFSRVGEEQNTQLQSSPFNATPVLQAIEIASDYARPVLKAEWNRVKQGEPQFRLVRNWVVPTVIVLCLLFAWVLFAVKIEA